jgi:hypothetical protein
VGGPIQGRGGPPAVPPMVGGGGRTVGGEPRVLGIRAPYEFDPILGLRCLGGFDPLTETKIKDMKKMQCVCQKER